MARSSEIDRWLDDNEVLLSEASDDEVDFAQQEIGLEGNYDGDESENDDPVLVQNRRIADVIESVVGGAGDCPLPRPRTDGSSEMVWETMEGYVPVRETFTGVCGPKIPVENPSNIFKCFFDDTIMDLIVSCTNSYAEQEREKRGMIFSRRSRDWNWKPVTKDEMYVYLAVIMLMGIDQKPSVRSYYSKNPLLETPIFPSTMPQERFEIISKYLHFSASIRLSEFTGPKKLFKIYPVVEHLSNRFMESYGLSQSVSIDESLTLWKGRLSFRQYLPLKSAQFGIKSFELCESSSGYTWSLLIYTGKTSQVNCPIAPPDSNKSTTIVVKLMEPLLDKGHTVWMDNWYNSPDLSAFLKNRKTDTCGTLKLSRKNVPQEIKDVALRKGEITALHSDNIMVLKWKDKRIVTVLSTFHDHAIEARTSKSGILQMKPVLVYDYNKQMGGVDLRDQMLNSFLLERKRGLKWYIKLFKRLLNISVLNSYIIWKTQNPKGLHLRFRLQLIQELIHTYGPEVQRPVHGRPSIAPKPARLTERHFIENIPATGKKQYPQRRCVVCSKRGIRKESVYWCPDCQAGLCLVNCFKDYHTKLDF